MTIAFVTTVGCDRGPDVHGDTSRRRSAVRCPVEPAAAILVKPLPPGRSVAIDGRLEEWTADLTVALVTTAQRWVRVDNASPARETASDSGALMALYMSHDIDYWYVAAHVTDNTFISPLPGHPYSGDCLELFVAAAHTESEHEMHYLIDKIQGQRALAQIQVPRTQLDRMLEHLSAWRTDTGLLQSVVQDGLSIKSVSDNGKFTLEMRMPLKSFDDQVLARIRKREPIKVGFNYLNYAHVVSERAATNRWGFDPDEVYADASEENVNVPVCMRALRFEY